jgi:hypothetical protein
MKNILSEMFSIRNEGRFHVKLTVLGKNCTFKKPFPSLHDAVHELHDAVRELNRMQRFNLSTAVLHQKTFLPFKNIHSNREITIVASGGTALRYSPIEGAVHIAVNRSFLLETVVFDYLFIQDYSGSTPSYIEDANNYYPGICVKFYGLTTEFDTHVVNRVIPEQHAIRAKALRYRTDCAPIVNYQPEFAYDISVLPLGCFGSTVFPALQFALWTNPSRIYLVGCDCTMDGYFIKTDGDKKKSNFLPVDDVIKAYHEFKHFASVYYPYTEIVSINPVGLKGVFKDVVY